MVVLNRHYASPILAGVLVLAFLAGGLPSLSGVMIADRGGPPAFTLDLCHSAPALNYDIGVATIPLTPAAGLFERPSASGMVQERKAPSLARIGEAPDPPPPKSRL